jgi:branched-chain amino acid transport system permease protein
MNFNVWYSDNSAVLLQMGVYLLLALSFQIVMRSGVLSFASIGVFGIGGYLSANLANHDVPVLGNLLVVVIIGWVLGWLVAVGFIRLRGLYLGMATFALNGLVQVVAINSGSFTGGSQGLYGVPIQLNTTQVLVVAVVVLLLVDQVERWSLGRSIAVLAVDERLGRSLGLEVDRHRRLIMGLSGALGALAGGLNTLATSTISPDSYGFQLSVAILTIAVLGGIASWRGALIGTIVVVWFPQVAGGLEQYQTIIYGLVVAAVAAVAPGGIYGAWRSLRQKLAVRSARTKDIASEATVPAVTSTPKPLQESHEA